MFKEGSRYYYAVIHRLDYGKNAARFVSGVEHSLQVLLVVKDESDPDFMEIENDLPYKIPTIRMKKQPVVCTVPKIDPGTGEQLVDDEGIGIFEEVENGFEEVVDETYEDPFLVEKMKPEGVDIVQLGYQWLKANVELFADFEDVLEEELPTN